MRSLGGNAVCNIIGRVFDVAAKGLMLQQLARVRVCVLFVDSVAPKHNLRHCHPLGDNNTVVIQFCPILNPS